MSEADPEEARAEDFRRRRHLANLQQQNAEPWDDNGEVRSQYLKQLVDSGVDFDEGTLSLVKNLLSQDQLLAKYSDANINEVRWLARFELERIKALHPGRESHLEGERRKVLWDDPEEGLSPLSPRQEAMLGQFLINYFGRISRGSAGWQQEILRKQIQVSETRDFSDDDDGSRMRGLFS